jgi:uncharacterized membrane protein
MPLKAALLNRWDYVRNSYWFVPLVMTTGAVALSFGTLEIDRRYASELSTLGWLYTGSPEGARSVLQTIASSMIGVAGVVFSITTVTLTLATKQFGPRIFRNFMGDTGTQVVLGTFLSTFLYCLLILRQVHGKDEDAGFVLFLPQASMFTAVLFAAASLVVLIYFIHHVAAKIQTPSVLAAVAADLGDTIRDLYPEEIGRDLKAEEAEALLRVMVPRQFEEEAGPVRSNAGGYVRQVEAGALVDAAREADVVVRLERRPGAFVAAGDELLRVWPPDRAGDLAGRLRDAVLLGDQPTPAQDVLFPVGQMVGIAVLALSPGINDLATAEMSIDRLREGLCLLARRRIPSAYRGDDEGRLRVIAPPIDLSVALDSAISPIRQNGRSQPTIMVRLLDVLAAVAARAVRPADRAAVLTHAARVHEQASAAGEHDREKLTLAFQRVRRACDAPPQEGVE